MRWVLVIVVGVLLILLGDKIAPLPGGDQTLGIILAVVFLAMMMYESMKGKRK